MAKVLLSFEQVSLLENALHLFRAECVKSAQASAGIPRLQEQFSHQVLELCRLICRVNQHDYILLYDDGDL